MHADDTTAILVDVESVSNLFELLSLFEKCSGLKINQAKSEMLWLGSMRHRRDAVCNIQISDDPVYALGVHFTYNTELSYKKNFFDKLGSAVSICGRINIVKTLALSKLEFISSVMETPKTLQKRLIK